MSDRRQFVNIRRDIKENTAFVSCELHVDLLKRVEEEARIKGCTTTTLLNDILTTAIVTRYPMQ